MFSMLQIIQFLTNWLKKITLVYTSEEKKTIKLKDSVCRFSDNIKVIFSKSDRS